MTMQRQMAAIIVSTQNIINMTLIRDEAAQHTRNESANGAQFFFLK